MLEVRVIKADIAGLEISSAVDGDGVIWLVIGADAPRPHHACAELLEELLGGLPDRLTFEGSSPAPPSDLLLAS